MNSGRGLEAVGWGRKVAMRARGDLGTIAMILILGKLWR